MGSGASKETATPEPPKPPAPTRQTVSKTDVIHIPTGEKSNDAFTSDNSSTDLPFTDEPSEQREKPANGGTTNISATEDYRSRPKLEWNPSIDSDLEHDTEDLKALQGELDQVLEGHSRVVSNRGYEKNPKSVFQPQKMDWRLPDDLLEQERSLVSVYNSQLSDVGQNQIDIDNRHSSGYLDTDSKNTGVVNGYRGKPQADHATTTAEIDNSHKSKEDFDPNKFKEANATKPNVDIYKEATYSDYKLEKSRDEVTSPKSVQVTGWRRHPLSAKSKKSLGFRYDSSEEQLMAEIENQFEL
ncbi:uncharacterized protein [Ptychodera flava]|uniref:uncharacterized protein n=1 Tax=Ptychodera flava TaxID=63121 RepID=UPI00396A078E